MSVHDVEIKGYEEKVRAELHKAKAQLDELGARAKGDFAQAQIDLLKDAKALHKEIEEKLHELKTTGDGNTKQLKADIDAKLANVKNSVTKLVGKLKEHAKAS